MMALSPGDRQDSAEASRRASAMRVDPRIRAWMRRARALFKDLPPGTWIYWQEDQMHLMVLTPEGGRYCMNFDGESSDYNASIGDVRVPRSDCGGW